MFRSRENNFYINRRIVMRRELILFAVLMVVFAMLFISARSVQASGGKYYSEINPRGFDGSEWEYTVYYYESTGEYKRIKFVFGYDKFLIKEDYAWSYSFYANHKTGVENDNGPAWSSNVLSGSWAKEEVTHSGDFVSYKFWVKDEEDYYRGGVEKSNMKP